MNAKKKLLLFDFAFEASVSSAGHLGRVLVEPGTQVPVSLIHFLVNGRHQQFSQSPFVDTVPFVSTEDSLPIVCLTGRQEEGAAPTNNDWSCEATQAVAEYSGSGLVYFRWNVGAEGAALPQLGFASVRPSSESWRLFGRLFLGLAVIQHLAHPSSARFPKKCLVRSCGLFNIHDIWSVEPKDSSWDPYPDSPSDADHMDFQDLDKLLKTAATMKSSGNALFRLERYHMAMFRFSKAIRYLNHVYSESRQILTAKDSSRLLALTVSCILNSSACKLKLHDYDGALEDCNEAMELAPADSKVLFRRGQAHHGKLNYEQSLYDLYRALKLAPNDKPIKSEIAAVEGEMQVYRKTGGPMRKISSPLP